MTTWSNFTLIYEGQAELAQSMISRKTSKPAGKAM